MSLPVIVFAFFASLSTSLLAGILSLLGEVDEIYDFTWNNGWIQFSLQELQGANQPVIVDVHPHGAAVSQTTYIIPEELVQSLHGHSDYQSCQLSASEQMAILLIFSFHMFQEVWHTSVTPIVFHINSQEIEIRRSLGPQDLFLRTRLTHSRECSAESDNIIHKNTVTMHTGNPSHDTDDNKSEIKREFILKSRNSCKPTKSDLPGSEDDEESDGDGCFGRLKKRMRRVHGLSNRQTGKSSERSSLLANQDVTNYSKLQFLSSEAALRYSVNAFKRFINAM